METHQQGECSQTGYHWAAGLNVFSWSGNEKLPIDLTLCVPVITEKGFVNINGILNTIVVVQSLSHT